MSRGANDMTARQAKRALPRTGAPYGSRALAPMLLSLAAFGCAPSAPPEDPTSAPTESVAASSKTAAPEDAPADPRVLLRQPSALPAPPASCPSATPLPAPSTCSELEDRLAAALALAPESSDEPLAELEKCSELPRGWVRAVRAERTPLCADVLALPVVGADADGKSLAAELGLPAGIHETLTGLGLAARLARASRDAPAPPTSGTRDALQNYFTSELFPWATAQAKAIAELSMQGSKLSGYARGVVAVEAAMADMRFVEMARRVPIPSEMSSDPELEGVYYASLDEALEPRKARGRDAALVGLASLRSAGVIVDARVTACRQLLGNVFGGRRIDTLDALLVPAEASGPSNVTPSASARVRGAVPVPYTTWLGPMPMTSDAIEAVLARGLTIELERALESVGTPEYLTELAHANFERGRTYVTRADFLRARDLARRVPAEARKKLSPRLEARLSFAEALGAALALAPESALDRSR